MRQVRAGRSAARPKGRKARRGFALLVVIWGLGIISLLVVSFMTTSRLRLQAGNSVASAARAGAIVEGVTNLAVMQLLKERDARLGAQFGAQTAGRTPGARPVYDGAPRFCAFDGAALMVAVSDEAGKIDLNAATPELLTIAMMGLGESEPRAASIAMSIVAFRTVRQLGAGQGAQASADRSFAPKNGLFETVMELDQVEGVDPEIFHRLAPLATVHSRSPGVNPRVAPPALFAALLGMKAEDVDALTRQPFPNNVNRDDPRFPAQLKGQSEGEAFAIRVEALLPNGQGGGRETIIDFGAGANTGFGPSAAFSVKEIRRAPSRYGDDLRRAIADAALAPC